MPMMASSAYRTYPAYLDVAREISKILGLHLLGVLISEIAMTQKMSGIVKQKNRN